jgi:hypothetical protein
VPDGNFSFGGTEGRLKGVVANDPDAGEKHLEGGRTVVGVGNTEIGLVFIPHNPAFGHIDQHKYPPSIPEGTGGLVGTCCLS